jgi:predicted lactoylglutathione lyase
VSLQVRDVHASKAFYETVLAPLGIASHHEDGAGVGFSGSDDESFWICPAQREQDRELHIAFSATDRRAVHAFHQAALGIGADVLHAPRVFPEYHEHYFGAFVRDPDGHNIEAVCHLPEG